MHVVLQAGTPMVGPVCEGLLVAAGHEGAGLTLAPATAELLCHQVLGDSVDSGLSAKVVEHLAVKLRD